MRDLVCIVCPRGCSMHIEEKSGEYIVTGNTCKRGEKFAISEMTKPMRTICTTVKTKFKDVPVLPVRVSSDIPKDKIFDVMSEINKVIIDKPTCRGDIIIKNVLNLGVDIISTSDILKNIT